MTHNFLLSANGEGLSSSLVMLVIVIALVFVTFLIVLASRYKKCPSDKIMVIHGKLKPNKDGTQRSSKCIHGGAAFVIPVLQAYDYLPDPAVYPGRPYQRTLTPEYPS